MTFLSWAIAPLLVEIATIPSSATRIVWHGLGADFITLFEEPVVIIIWLFEFAENGEGRFTNLFYKENRSEINRENYVFFGGEMNLKQGGIARSLKECDKKEKN